MLAGATLYGPRLDETNPPLIIWISAIPVLLAGLLHIPVILTLNNGLSINSNVAFSSHPVARLALQLASDGLTLNGADTLDANVVAPGGTVTLNGNATLRGTVKADRLIVNGNALLENP